MSQHCHLFHHYHRHYHKRHRVHHYQCLAGQRLLLVDSCHDRLGHHLYRNQLRIRRHLQYHPDHYLAISHRLEREGGREGDSNTCMCVYCCGKERLSVPSVRLVLCAKCERVNEI